MDSMIILRMSLSNEFVRNDQLTLYLLSHSLLYFPSLFLSHIVLLFFGISTMFMGRGISFRYYVILSEIRRRPEFAFMQRLYAKA